MDNYFQRFKTIQQTFSLKNIPSIPELYFDGQIIKNNDNHKHLGISLSTDLRFKSHTNEVINKVNKALGPIYPIARYVPRKTLNQMYVTYIQPYFDYCDLVYDGLITKTDSLKLERLQNRAARLITGTMKRTPTDKLRTELGWATLEDRRKIHKLLLYHHLQTKETREPSYIYSILPDTRESQTGRSLRNSDTFTQTTSRTSLFDKTYIPSTTRLWNQLPLAVRQTNHTTFKRFLYQRFSPPHPPTYFSHGSKLGNLLHTRLRVETSQLNAHLHKLQIIDTPSCSCGHRSETVEHFILHCTLYNDHRNILYQELSLILNINFRSLSKSLRIEILINGRNLSDASGRKVADCFQKYILNSGRFR